MASYGDLSEPPAPIDHSVEVTTAHSRVWRRSRSQRRMRTAMGMGMGMRREMLDFTVCEELWLSHWLWLFLL